jgi:hypothetical protein
METTNYQRWINFCTLCRKDVTYKYTFWDVTMMKSANKWLNRVIYFTESAMLRTFTGKWVDLKAIYLDGIDFAEDYTNNL